MRNHLFAGALAGIVTLGASIGFAGGGNRYLPM